MKRIHAPLLAPLLALLLALALTFCALFAFTACDNEETDDANDPAKIEAAKYAVCYAVITFREVGEVVLKLDYQNAPITVKNFCTLAESGFYNGLTIIRIQEGFVIQGGQNNAVDLAPIKGEFKENGVNNKITHTKGVISMARTSEPNSATSQFFLCLDNVMCPLSLDGKYAGFGTTVKGLDVIDSIVERYARFGDTGYMGFIDDPAHQPVIDSVEIFYSEADVAPHLAD